MTCHYYLMVLEFYVNCIETIDIDIPCNKHNWNTKLNFFFYIFFFRELCAMETILLTVMATLQTMGMERLTAVVSVNHLATYHWCIALR